MRDTPLIEEGNFIIGIDISWEGCWMKGCLGILGVLFIVGLIMMGVTAIYEGISGDYTSSLKSEVEELLDEKETWVLEGRQLTEIKDVTLKKISDTKYEGSFKVVPTSYLENHRYLANLFESSKKFTIYTDGKKEIERIQIY
jgi:hypothetical protein